MSHLILQFTLKNKNYIMEIKYECFPDTYSGEIKVAENEIYFIIRIKGQRKNEKITYHYEE